LESREDKLDKGMNVTYPMPVVNLHSMHYLNFQQATEISHKGGFSNTRTHSKLFIPKLWEAHETVFTMRCVCVCLSIYMGSSYESYGILSSKTTESKQ